MASSEPIHHDDDGDDDRQLRLYVIRSRNHADEAILADSHTNRLFHLLGAQCDPASALDHELLLDIFAQLGAFSEKWIDRIEPYFGAYLKD